MSDEPRRVSEGVDAALEQAARIQGKAAQSGRVPDEPATVSAAARREAQWAELIPRRYLGAGLDQLEPSVAEALTDWRAIQPAVNLVLQGPEGVGKTHAAVVALRMAWEAAESVKYSNVADLLAEIRPGGDPAAYAWATQVGVLLLDDLGAIRDTGWTDETLYRLVDARWRDIRPIVATTNVPLEELRTVVGDRVYGRLCLSDAICLRLGGESRRRGQ